MFMDREDLIVKGKYSLLSSAQTLVCLYLEVGPLGR